MANKGLTGSLLVPDPGNGHILWGGGTTMSVDKAWLTLTAQILSTHSYMHAVHTLFCPTHSLPQRTMGSVITPVSHRSGQGGTGSCSDLPKAPQWGRVRDRIWLQASLNLIEEGGWIQFCEMFVGIEVGIFTSPAKGSALWKNTMLSCWDGAPRLKGLDNTSSNC